MIKIQDLVSLTEAPAAYNGNPGILQSVCSAAPSVDVLKIRQSLSEEQSNAPAVQVASELTKQMTIQ